MKRPGGEPLLETTHQYNMKTSGILSLAILLCTSLPGAAQDQPQKPRKPHGPPPPELIKEFDKDGDGKLSDEERQAMRESMRARMEARKKEMLERFDADQDGKLSDAERENARKTIKAEMLEKYDKDGDGKLSKEERASMPRPPGRSGGPHGRRGPGRPPGAETE
jgi:Ca2+-binding EF-hand superfamily protein